MTDLSISTDGVISTIVNDTFDYETQTQVLVQIQAVDTLQTYPGEKSNRFVELLFPLWLRGYFSSSSCSPC